MSCIKFLGLCAIFSLGFILGGKKERVFQWVEKKIQRFIEKKSSLLNIHPIKEHKAFVFIIPSFNNAQWVEKNLRSVFEQKYDNFRVIYIDDASEDNTLKRAQALIAAHRQEHRVELWHNEVNRGALENIYKAVQSCIDQEIAIICDGDDWLAHDNVLQKLNEAYADPCVWATYGSYIEYPSYSYTVANFALHIPHAIIVKNQVRHFSKEHWCLSHMRTFYAGLGKRIQVRDLLYEGKYYNAAADVALMIPIAEMAGEHLCFINEILYIYNRASLLNDNKVRADRQRLIAQHIFSLPPYSPVTSPFL